MKGRYPDFRLAGTRIHLLSSSDMLSILGHSIQEGQQTIIASQNMHGLYMLAREPAFRALHELPNTYVHIDGMPIVALCRLCGIAAKFEHRVTMVDFVWPLLEEAQRRDWDVCFIGSSDAVIAAGLDEIRCRFPSLRISALGGYFDEVSGESVALRVKALAPSLLLVGMGMGRQERWILRNLERLNHVSIITVGAMMEYVAGEVRTPPRWMGSIGMEWLFRFCERPQRFWFRYFVEPWFVMALFVAHWMRARSSSADETHFVGR